MKKNLTVLCVFILLLLQANALQYNWTNGSGNKLFSNAGNWSPVRTGPNNFDTLVFTNISDTVFFDGLLLSGTIFLRGNSNTVFVATVNTGSTASPNVRVSGLDIATGTKLKVAGSNSFFFYFLIGANDGLINGELEIAGTGTSCIFSSSDASPKVIVNGVFRMSSPVGSMLGGFNAGAYSIKFTNGSQLIWERNGGLISNAEFETNSTIKVTGQTVNTSGVLSSSLSYGNIEWNCPGQTAVLNLFSSSAITVKGDFNVVNTGTGRLQMGTATNLTIEKNLIVNDDTDLGNTASGTAAVIVVNGNFSQTNGKFDLSPNTDAGVLRVKGNVLQTGGSITETGTSTASAMELNGTAVQTIAAPFLQNAVNLAINNAAGISLTAPVTTVNNLQFISGRIAVNNFGLTCNTTSGFSNSSYVITNGQGTFTLKAVTNAVFPVGPNTTSYNPITVSNGGGLDYQSGVAAFYIPQPANPLKGINRQWGILPTGAPTGVTVAFQYEDAHVNAGCIPTASMEVGRLNQISLTWELFNPSVMPTGTGPRIITLTNISLFGAFIVGNTGFVLNPSAVTNLDNGIQRFRLLPTVVNNDAVLRIKSNRTDQLQLQVMNMNGQVVYSSRQSIVQGENTVNLQLVHLPAGQYQLKGITSKGVTETLRFVKQ